MPKEKILITVKTYPTISSTYDETVCTAGLREDGTWIRIYPIPFRKMDEFEQYRKFEWVELTVERNLKDPRPESYKKKSGIRVLGFIDSKSKSGWRERNRYVLENGRVFTSFDEIIEKNKNNRELSLATFKPTEIIDLKIGEVEREWDPEKIRLIEARSKQNDLFDANTECFKVVQKLPYKFQYIFKDDTGNTRTLTITDWEIGQLYWNCLKRHGGNEKKALADVKQKYLVELIENRDPHFFVGTTQEWDVKNAPNPFMIVGVYSPPFDPQESLF